MTDYSFDKSKVLGSSLLGVLVVFVLIVVSCTALLMRRQVGKSQLKVYEGERLLKLGMYSAANVLKAAIEEAVKEDNYWVIKQEDGSCAIVSPYKDNSSKEWRYRYTGLSSRGDWIDLNRNESDFFRPLSSYSADAEVKLSLDNGAGVEVEGLMMPVSDEYEVRLSWWVQDEGAKLSPRARHDSFGEKEVASYAKIPGINDSLEGWQKLGGYFGLNKSQSKLWESLVEQWQEGAVGVDDFKYQLQIAKLPDDFIKFVNEDLSFLRVPYEEVALVPVKEWSIKNGLAGKPKINLNAYINKDRDLAISELESYITRALPNWEFRKGGFPENYTKTVVANILDYADSDEWVSSKIGEYRGTEAVPWINEWVVRYETNKVWDDGRNAYEYSLLISVYAELWNMSYEQVTGDLEVSYEPGLEMVSSKASLPLVSHSLLQDPEMSSHQLEFSQIKGKWLFEKQKVELQANEHKLVKLGSVSYHLDAIGRDFLGLRFYEQDKAVILKELFQSYELFSYRSWWNGVLVDRAGWSNSLFGSKGLSQNLQLKVYTESSTKNKIKTRLYHPSFTYRNGISYRQSLGDPRLSYYIGGEQAAAAYPANYSPRRRNVKLGLYLKDDVYKLNPSTRVLPSEWADGGHNLGYYPNHSFNQQSTRTAIQTIEPDHEVFLENNQIANPSLARSYYANRGYLVSETEMARVADPVMWSNFEPLWSGYTETAVQDIDDNSLPSAVVGGGNTLRIGRSEHPLFVKKEAQASQLLDIFHVGLGWSVDNQSNRLKGATQKMQGAINLNTVGQKTLEVILSGILESDDNLGVQVDAEHEGFELLAPKVDRGKESGDTGSNEINSKKIAKAIIDYKQKNIIRSMVDLLEIKGSNGVPVFSNLEEYHVFGEELRANDAAQEELFARLYNQSTVRSKNFAAYVQVELVNKQGRVIGVKKQKVFITVILNEESLPEVILLRE